MLAITRLFIFYTFSVIFFVQCFRAILIIEKYLQTPSNLVLMYPYSTASILNIFNAQTWVILFCLFVNGFFKKHPATTESFFKKNNFSNYLTLKFILLILKESFIKITYYLFLFSRKFTINLLNNSSNFMFYVKCVILFGKTLFLLWRPLFKRLSYLGKFIKTSFLFKNNYLK